jgi:hypothetical protein
VTASFQINVTPHISCIFFRAADNNDKIHALPVIRQWFARNAPRTSEVRKCPSRKRALPFGVSASILRKCSFGCVRNRLSLQTTSGKMHAIRNGQRQIAMADPAVKLKFNIRMGVLA